MNYSIRLVLFSSVLGIYMQNAKLTHRLVFAGSRSRVRGWYCSGESHVQYLYGNINSHHNIHNLAVSHRT